MYIFRGHATLSKLRIEQLFAAIQLPCVYDLHCECIYFLRSDTSLTPATIKKLSTILVARIDNQNTSQDNNTCLQDNQKLIIVVPKLGTISPWASKAIDILHHCGMQDILQIERGTIWTFTCQNAHSINQTDLTCASSVLHDRMTEIVLYDMQETEQIFSALDHAPLQNIEVLRKGADALEQANNEMCLALSTAEIAYLVDHFTKIGRDPTDAELMMFAQINSEHCRHKIFNAHWTIDNESKNHSLFDMIRHTYHKNPNQVLSAYHDNAAIIQGGADSLFSINPKSYQYQMHDADMHIVIKVETHNHPTAISPFPGAATGSGGEIRDEVATGRGAKPKAGLIGFSVSNLKIPDFQQAWEIDHGKPNYIASALQIMLEAPIGAASYNNEFGRPSLAGYFRTYEQQEGSTIHGYHKPIMLAGGYGMIRDDFIKKHNLPAKTQIVVLGGPGMLIGIGGGGASSVTSDAKDAELHFASVQRSNPEMQRRCQGVIDACCELGTANPILSIHDVGAGGLANALTELVADSQKGAIFELRDIHNADPSMSPMAIWCNESQERYVLAITHDGLDLFKRFCQRERAPFSIIGTTDDVQRIIVNDALLQNKTIDLPIDLLLGKLPHLAKNTHTKATHYTAFNIAEISLSEAIHRLLHLPTIADKHFLITISDRSISGLVARDQMVGPWQTPTADCAVTCSTFHAYNGEAMALGERAPIALIDAPAAGRMAVGEALTNIAAARILKLQEVVLSANWMAACEHTGEYAKLFGTVRAVSQMCQAIGICIPVGKDSLSMHTAWTDQENNENVSQHVVAPLSLVISAFAPVTDVRKSLTPELCLHQEDTRLLLIDLGLSKNRLGGSSLTQVYQKISADPADCEDFQNLKIFFSAIQSLNAMGLILAYHDRSDGGLFISLCEMAFSARVGLDVHLSNVQDAIPTLFNEELGAVIQIRANDVDKVHAAFKEASSLLNHIHDIGTLNQEKQFKIFQNNALIFSEDIYNLHRTWSETTFKIQSLRDNPLSAKQEYMRLFDTTDAGLFVEIQYDADKAMHAPYINIGAKPKIAILREQGVNGHVEMAAAFHHVAFECVDVHMTDIIENKLSFDAFKGLVACGGFSYGDVLGAGRGWANSILFNDIAKNAFRMFFARKDTFALGVCNGCQMFSHIKAIIPGAENWPTFKKNISEQFEARLVMVEILDSPSIFLNDMQGSKIPITVAHQEGLIEYENTATINHSIATMRYVDNAGIATETYPKNPNGSEQGLTGFTTNDGRYTIMMPHPERSFLKTQYSWLPESWVAKNGPWMKFFYNARVWVD